MTIGFFSRFLGLLVCTTLVLSACDDGGGGKTDTDAGMDAGDDDDMDAAEAEDTSPPRDAGHDSAPVVDTGSPYTCEPPPGPDGTVPVGEACCEGLGTCIALTGDAGSGLGVGDCNAAENLRCLPLGPLGDAGAPSDAGADGGTSGLAKCRMQPANTPDGGTDYEGRCVPECLTRGAASLEQGECNADFVCVPCYSLITGASTGACNNPGDAPVDPAPMGFDECGEMLGYCVPNTSVGDAGVDLMQLTCDEDESCVPKQRVTSPNACFAQCGSPFGPGACVPAFLVPEGSRSFLPQAECQTGELCSPCVHPTTMMPTGVCS
jgi:hypothetical protein